MLSLSVNMLSSKSQPWGQVAASQASSFRDKGGWPRATFYLVALEIPDIQSALLTEGAWAPGCKDPTRTLEQTHCNELVLDGPSLPGPLAQLPQYQHARPCQPAHLGTLAL